jgi:hypothetical protein
MDMDTILSWLPVLSGWILFIMSELVAMNPKWKNNALLPIIRDLLKALAKKKVVILYFLLFWSLILLQGCVRSYVVPEVCKESSSIILNHAETMKFVDQGLLGLQLTALKKMDSYSTKDAFLVIDQLEALLQSPAITYTTLLAYANKIVDRANNDIGAVVFILGGDLTFFDKDIFITNCDKALIASHLARQRGLIMVYSM